MAITINGTGNGKINNTSFSTTTGNAVTTGDSGTVTEGMLSSDFIEEGTFQPTFGGTSTSTGQTYNNQTCHYKKVGPLVYVAGRLKLIAKGTMSGGSAALIKGLPFTHGTQTAGRSGCSTYTSWENITGSSYSIRSYVSADLVSLLENTTANGVALTDITNTSQVDFNILYYTDE